jgi:hypothetical protein
LIMHGFCSVLLRLYNYLIFYFVFLFFFIYHFAFFFSYFNFCILKKLDWNPLMIRTRLAFLPHPIHTNKTTTKIKKIPNAGSSNSLRRPIKPKSLLISVATTTQPVREREYTPLSDFQFLPLFYLFIYLFCRFIYLFPLF